MQNRAEDQMNSERFEAIFFDLFNTLLHFDYSRLPEVKSGSEQIRTTSVEVYRRLKERFAVGFSYEMFLKEFWESYRIVSEMRQEEGREIASLFRFRILGQRLGLEADAVAEFMVQVHMGEMFRITYFPEEKRAVFDKLSDYPLILVSNFDHAATARRALRAFGMENRFQAVFISEEVGWRKPSQRFFDAALKKSGAVAERCLYVGDDPSADVAGGVEAGFQVAWLAEADVECPSPKVAPRWTLRHFSQLLDLVGKN